MSNWSQNQINQVWKKGSIVSGNDPNIWRKDRCGAWMKKSLHGVQQQYGWEIDHIYPEALGGSDELGNLQPLQWKNNRNKGDSLGSHYCCVTADGVSNKDNCDF